MYKTSISQAAAAANIGQVFSIYDFQITDSMTAVHKIVFVKFLTEI